MKLVRLVVAGWLVLASAAWAGPKLEMTLDPYGTYADTEDFGTLWGGGGKLRLEIGKYCAVDFRGTYLNVKDAGYQVVPLEAAATIRMPLGQAERVIPYLGLGGGYYLFQGDQAPVKDSGGFFPVGGLDIVLGEDVSVFAEIRWVVSRPEVEPAWRSIVGRDELKLDGAYINVGFSIRF